MAWAGIILGMIAGFAAAVLGYAAAGLSVWVSLLLYPGAGLSVAMLVIGAAALRSRMQPQPRLKPALGGRA
ncbi:hypothetical protein RA19_09485 [Leisingera sp. ANG-M1]|uniref:hypothetical protein n=1 Tax=Leisingera sp. ANG-M1 TaxID=1577895 RepID=UPI0005806EA0|nr:hypothetical protein [Leisingera sp. ANG-M1]KIC10952.1 hypothetical protein RA19_09485 [Leisingera sp. ANG-M1]